MTPDAPLSRLAREYQRLFLSSGTPLPGADAVRALVLDVSGPAAWQALGAVWQGVQTDLDLPAPAVAVNGSDGLQLWFSLAVAMDAVQGRALLENLRRHYMADVPLHRVAMQVVTAAVITDWSKWGRVVAVAIMVVPWAAIDCLVLADPNGRRIALAMQVLTVAVID